LPAPEPITGEGRGIAPEGVVAVMEPGLTEVPEANDGLCETMTLVIFFYIKLLTGCVNSAVFL
jgi:hypothetical protein